MICWGRGFEDKIFPGRVQNLAALDTDMTWQFKFTAYLIIYSSG